MEGFFEDLIVLGKRNERRAFEILPSTLTIEYQHTGYVLSVVCSRGQANRSDLTPQGTAATAMTGREDNDTSVQSQSQSMRSRSEGGS